MKKYRKKNQNLKKMIKNYFLLFLQKFVFHDYGIPVPTISAYSKYVTPAIAPKGKSKINPNILKPIINGNRIIN